MNAKDAAALPANDTVSISDARQHLANLVNLVAFRHKRVQLARRGTAIAAIVSAEDYALLEELDRHLDLAALKTALLDPLNSGPGVSIEAFAAQLGIDLD